MEDLRKKPAFSDGSSKKISSSFSICKPALVRIPGGIMIFLVVVFFFLSSNIAFFQSLSRSICLSFHHPIISLLSFFNLISPPLIPLTPCFPCFFLTEKWNTGECFKYMLYLLKTSFVISICHLQFIKNHTTT